MGWGVGQRLPVKSNRRSRPIAALLRLRVAPTFQPIELPADVVRAQPSSLAQLDAEPRRELLRHVDRRRLPTRERFGPCRIEDPPPDPRKDVPASRARLAIG